MKQAPKDSLRSVSRKIFIGSIVPIALVMGLCLVQYWQISNERKVVSTCYEIEAILIHTTEKLVDQKNSKKSLIKSLRKVPALLAPVENLVAGKGLAVAKGKFEELMANLEKVPEASFLSKRGSERIGEIRRQVYRVMELFRGVAKRHSQERTSNVLVFLVVLEFLLVLIALGTWSLAVVMNRIVIPGVDDAARYAMSIDRHQKIIEAPKVMYLELARLIELTKMMGDKLLISRNEAIERAAQAESVMHAKNNFFVSLSHQIRTPLNGIIGFIDFLEDSSLNEDQKSWVQNIRDSSEMLAALTKDTLDLAKLEASKIRVERREFDLKAAINHSLAMMQSLAASRNVVIETMMINRPPVRIVSDSVRLEQVLTNLLSNGIKFSNEGGKIELSIELVRMIDAMSCCLKFSIKDEGPGIRKEHQESIFEPFSNVEPVSSEPITAGTGLGLALSRKIVRSMGGDLTLESEQGRGSTFSFEMIVGIGSEQKVSAPMAPSNPPIGMSITGTTKEVDQPKVPPPITASVEEVPPIQSSEPTPDPLLPPLRILLVEDNLINQKLLQNILKKIGYDCVIANNGLEATEFCSKLEFDIIFMDLKMPKKDGITASREILQMPNNKSSIIIAVTANAFEEERAVCISAGMAAYVPKPVSLQSIETEMFRQLAKRGITKEN